MTWEIAVGVFTLVGAFVSVTGVVVKVNGTLTRLDEAVRRLSESIDDEQRRSESFSKTLAAHETRITVREDTRRRV